MLNQIWHRGRRTAICVVALFAVSAAFAVSAPAATTFTNPTSIAFSSGAASNGSVYPSSITVTGMPDFVSDINVGINGFTHTFPSDIGAVLVAPNGAAFKVLDGVGAGADITNVNLTLDDSAAALLPGSLLTTGSYRPTSYATGGSYPAPGPLLAYAEPAEVGTATLASSFSGINPNGTWNLFTRDWEDEDGGSFSGGWSLSVSTEPLPTVGAISSTPVSPADDNSPEIKGVASLASTVRIYPTANCTGAVVAEGSPAAFASPGLTVSVADNTTTQFSAKAINGAGGACSPPITYVESTPPPVVTPPVVKPSGKRSGVKKCKKGFKKKKVKGKSRCVKKAVKHHR